MKQITVFSCCLCVVFSPLNGTENMDNDSTFSLENTLVKTFNLNNEGDSRNYTIKNGNIVSKALYDENGKINRVYAYDSSQIKDAQNSEQAEMDPSVKLEVDTKIDSNENGDTIKITTLNQEFKFDRDSLDVKSATLNDKMLFNKEIYDNKIIQNFANDTKIEREQIDNNNYCIKYGSLNEYNIKTDNGSLPTSIIDKNENETSLEYNDYSEIISQNNEYGAIRNESGGLVNESFGSIVTTLQSDSTIEVKYGNKECSIEKTENGNSVYHSVNYGKYCIYTFSEDNSMCTDFEDALGNYEHYTYDDLGYLICMDKNGTSATKYFYDDYGRLSASYIDGFEHLYAYDNNGNLAYEKSVNGDAEYSFDNEANKNQLTSINDKKLVYDEFGNLTSFDELELEWDAGQILTFAGTHDNKCTYEYDVNKLRKRKIANGEITDYQYFNGKLLSSRNKYGVTHYFYNDEGIAMGFVFNGSIYFYVRDAMNNIKSILDERLNEVVVYEYDDLGVPAVLRCSSDDVLNSNCLIYKDYIYDYELNLYYLGSRYYLPSIRRFISQDDLEKISNSGSKDYNFNLYSYSNNNPIMLSDGLGYEAITISISLIVVAIACVALYISATLLANMIAKETAKDYRIYDSKTSYYLEQTINDFSKVVKELKKAATLAFDSYVVTIWMWWNNNRHDEHHHIISQNASRCYESRRLFTVVYGHDIDDWKLNMIWLKFRLHKHLHTNAYYDTVNEYLLLGNRLGGENIFLAHLREIKNVLRTLNDSLVF